MKFLRFLLLILSMHFLASDSFAQTSNVTLYANRTWGMPGDSVTVEVRVNGFIDIISFQASLNWDAGQLKFLGVSDFGIREFDEQNFGTSSAAKGHVRFLWEPSDAKADTLQDSTVLFVAHFEVIASYRMDVAVGFVDESLTDPFPIEFVNSLYEPLTVKPYAANVKVILELTDLLNIVSTPNTSCDEKNPTGSLHADIDGDTVNYSFLWFSGNVTDTVPDHTGPSFLQIPDGDYLLRVLDKNDAVFIEKFNTTVKRDAPPADTITVIRMEPQRTCSADTAKHTGLLEITVNNAQDTGRYNITWWAVMQDSLKELASFRNRYLAMPLDRGDYEIAVDNPVTGCKSYLRTAVADSTARLQLTLTSSPNNYCKNQVNGSATAIISDASSYDLRHYWFMENDDIDTVAARARGPVYDSIAAGSYKAWVIDLPTECVASGVVTVEDSLAYYPLEVTYRNDTLFANHDMANWFRDGVYINETGPYIVPNKTGDYHVTYTNEYGCFSESEPYFYQVTALDDSFEKMTIFPNPFHNSLRISNPEGVLEFVRVYDTFGRLILEKSNIKEKFTDLRLTGSPDGLYLIRIGKDGKIFTGKVIKNLSK